jgi:hypothetical protein
MVVTRRKSIWSRGKWPDLRHPSVLHDQLAYEPVASTRATSRATEHLGVLLEAGFVTDQIINPPAPQLHVCTYIHTIKIRSAISLYKSSIPASRP